jgi:hypothetical protein
MLAVLLISIVIGLVGAVYGRWQNISIVVIAMVMTSLYFFVQRVL